MLISITNLMIGGEFFTVNVEISDSVYQSILRVRWHDVVSRRFASALRVNPNQDVTEIVEAILSNLTAEDLDGPSNDALEAEALQLAEYQIVTELAKDGLPPPKAIKDHAKMLLNSNPKLYDEAKRRIMARQQVLRETLPITI